MAIGSLTEDNLEHCAVVLYEELAWGHTVVGEADMLVSTVSSWLQAADRYASREGEAGEEKEDG